MGAMAADRVVIKHPKTGNTSTVTPQAFELAWKGRGWEKVTDDLSKLNKPEVVAIAEKTGVDTSGTKDEIAARIQTKQES